MIRRMNESGRPLDLKGEKFDYLKVIKMDTERSADRKLKWICKCDCGTKLSVVGARLTSGHTKSCGCKSNQIKDLTGKKFGLLRVVGPSKKPKDDRSRFWECRCACGNTTHVRTSALNNGSSQSCGCKRIKSNSGENHFRVKNIIKKYGEAISTTDPWYQMASRTLHRCKEFGIRTGFKSRAEFGIYLRNLATERCPVFNEPFVFGHKNVPDKMSPSIDKIIPKKGYVRGNIQIISYKANTMKQDATLDEREQHALWTLKQVKELRKNGYK